MSTALVVQSLDHADAVLDRAESLLAHDPLNNLGGAVQALEEVQSVLQQSLPAIPETGSLSQLMPRLSSIQDRARRIGALVEGAAEFHRAWANAFGSDGCYGADGALNESAGAQFGMNPARVRATG